MDQNGQFYPQYPQQQFQSGGAIDQGLPTSIPIDPNVGEAEPMFFLHGQPEADFKWAPPGRYPFRVQKADAARTGTKDRSAMLVLQLAIEGFSAELDGVMCFDRMIVEKGKPGAGIGVKKAKGLGLPIDSPVAIPLSQICQGIVGKLIWADVDVEPRMAKGDSGKYDVPVTTVRDGKKIAVMQNRVEGYYLHDVRAQGVQQGVQATAQQQFSAPAYMPQPGAQQGGTQQGGVFAPQQLQQPLQSAVPLQQQAALQLPVQGQAPVQQLGAPAQGQQMAQFPPMQLNQQAAPWGTPAAQAQPIESAKSGKGKANKAQ